MTLGVLDWGIGGLFAVRHALAREPALDLVYLSDAGNVPYGRQPRRELARSVAAALHHLAEAGATEILVACHSASTALPDLRPPVPTRGVIDARGVPAGARRLGLVGGARTIRSGAWRRLLVGRDLRQRVAQPLSAHVEAGRLDHPDTARDLARILGPLRGVDALILACTHYAALAGAIGAAVPGAILVDPALSVVDALDLRPGTARRDWRTSGDPDAMRAVARVAVGLGLGPVRRVAIPR